MYLTAEQLFVSSKFHTDWYSIILHKNILGWLYEVGYLTQTYKILDPPWLEIIIKQNNGKLTSYWHV